MKLPNRTATGTGKEESSFETHQKEGNCSESKNAISSWKEQGNSSEVDSKTPKQFQNQNILTALETLVFAVTSLWKLLVFSMCLFLLLGL